MTCPICEYRRIAREAMDVLERVSKLLGMLDPDAQKWGLGHVARLSKEFRETYRAEHAAAA